MNRSDVLRVVMICSLVLLLASAPTSAGQFTKLVVLGDSLSDTGNVFEMTGGHDHPDCAVPSESAYFAGHFSNGPVWVEYLGEALNVPFENHAYGGAKTDRGNLFDGSRPDNCPRIDFPGLADEVDIVTQAGVLDPDAVYIVWAGANDFRAALLTGAPLDFGTIIGNLVSAVGALYAAGARQIVVPNLPDLGLTPEGRASGAGPLLTFLSATFNAHLDAALAASTPAAVRIDIFDLMTQTVNAPAEYGFTNVTTPCRTAASECATPDTFLFWDHVHPTTAGHALLADKFARTINQAFVRQHQKARR